MEEIKKEIPEDLTKEKIRCIVSAVYNLQRTRISAGNRIVASFYQGKETEEAGGKDAEVDSDPRIKVLSKEYKRITDKIVNDGISFNKAIKELDKSEEPLEVLRTKVDYQLMTSYMKLLESKDDAIKVLDKYVKTHPMWDAFFKDVKGCGTLMAGVCLAYINPYKARHVSSLFKYAGVDVVQNVDEEGNPLFKDKNGNLLREKYVYISEDGESYSRDEVVKEDEDGETGEVRYKTSRGVYCTKERVYKNVTLEVDGDVQKMDMPLYENIKTGEEVWDEVQCSMHGRRRSDTELFDYVDKDGVVRQKRGLTYNPVLKSKLMGVLSSCILKAQDPVYSAIYYDMRNRLDNSAAHKDVRTIQKHKMALRYMIKQFLRNLWTTWRELEGLTVSEPYEVAKLGNMPHKYNQYQVDTARRI